MLKFNISDTYAGPPFIDLNICCGFSKKCVNKFFQAPNSYIKTNE